MANIQKDTHASLGHLRLARKPAVIITFLISATLVFALTGCRISSTADGLQPEDSPPASLTPTVEATPSASSESRDSSEFALFCRQGNRQEILQLGVQTGLYTAWELLLSSAEVTSSTSSDMPDTVFYRADGEGFRLFYQHTKDTSADVLTAFMTTSPDFVTPREITVGDTVEQLLTTYDSSLLYQKQPFPVSQDLGGDFCVYDELYIYTFQEDGKSSCLCFYVIDKVDSKRISGIGVFLNRDGSPMYCADHESTFPVDYENPDTYIITDTEAEQKVHVLFNTPSANGDSFKAAVLEAVTDINWRIYTQLYGSDETMLVLDWLLGLEITNQQDVLSILKGTTGLDGAYTESYASLLARLYLDNPALYIKSASTLDEATIDTVARLLHYGLSYREDFIVSALETYKNQNELTANEQHVVSRILYYFSLWS